MNKNRTVLLLVLVSSSMSLMLNFEDLFKSLNIDIHIELIPVYDETDTKSIISKHFPVQTSRETSCAINFSWKQSIMFERRFKYKSNKKLIELHNLVVLI